MELYQYIDKVCCVPVEEVNKYLKDDKEKYIVISAYTNIEEGTIGEQHHPYIVLGHLSFDRVSKWIP